MHQQWRLSVQVAFGIRILALLSTYESSLGSVFLALYNIREYVVRLKRGAFLYTIKIFLKFLWSFYFKYSKDFLLEENL